MRIKMGGMHELLYWQDSARAAWRRPAPVTPNQWKRIRRNRLCLTGTLNVPARNSSLGHCLNMLTIGSSSYDLTFPVGLSSKPALNHEWKSVEIKVFRIAARLTNHYFQTTQMRTCRSKNSRHFSTSLYLDHWVGWAATLQLNWVVRIVQILFGPNRFVAKFTPWT